MPKREDEEPEDDDADDEGGDDSARGSDDLDDRIERTVRRVMAEVLPGSKDGGKSGEGDSGGGEKLEGKPARTAASVEVDFESKVKEVVNKIKSDEDRDRRLAALEEREKSRVTPERAPTKERRSTRLMGW